MELLVSGSTQSKFGFVVFTKEGIALFSKEPYQRGSKLEVKGDVIEGEKGKCIKNPIITVIGTEEVVDTPRECSSSIVAFKKVNKSPKGWVATDIFDNAFFSREEIVIGIYTISFSKGNEMSFIVSCTPLTYPTIKPI